MAFAPMAGGGLPNRALELAVGGLFSTAAWKEAPAMSEVFVRWFEGEEGLSAGFDVCKAELLRHVTVAAERVRRLAV